MSTARFAFWVAFALVFLGLLYSAGHAEDAFWKGLKQPDTGISCCNISDCKLTKAYRYVDDHWEVDHSFWRSTQAGDKVSTVVPIPPNKILEQRSRPQGIDPDEAVFCASNYSPTVYCFLPPDMGF